MAGKCKEFYESLLIKTILDENNAQNKVDRIIQRTPVAPEPAKKEAPPAKD